MASLVETTGGGTVYTNLPSPGKTIPVTNPLLDSATGNRTLLWECRDFGVRPRSNTAGTPRTVNNVEFNIVPGLATFISPMKVTNLGTSMKTITLVVRRESGDEYYWERGFPVGAGETAHLQIQGFALLKATGEELTAGDSLFAEVEVDAQMQVYSLISESALIDHQLNTREA
jgi:hypothetical protein